MVYKLREVTYSELADLIQEAKDTNSFLPIREDKGSFLDIMGQFEGLPDQHFFSTKTRKQMLLVLLQSYLKRRKEFSV